MNESVTNLESGQPIKHNNEEEWNRSSMEFQYEELLDLPQEPSAWHRSCHQRSSALSPTLSHLDQLPEQAHAELVTAQKPTCSADTWTWWCHWAQAQKFASEDEVCVITAFLSSWNYTNKTWCKNDLIH